MGCDTSNMREEMLEDQCTEHMEAMVRELCAIDRYEKVTRDMKKFMFGRRITASVILQDVWKLYTEDRRNYIDENDFVQIFYCYLRALIRALPEWVENVAFLSLDCIGVRLSRTELKASLKPCRRQLYEETGRVQMRLRSGEIYHRAWSYLLRYQREQKEKTYPQVIDWTTFSQKFLRAAESAWEKKVFWRRICAIVWPHVSKLTTGVEIGQNNTPNESSTDSGATQKEEKAVGPPRR
uniref:Uncharacterized protein n=1 Tax=Lotharella oceanica TaxID=641309 RepID=A0A7S2TKK7_9EUKA|mmetsp:Transcript_16777/g.31795  ORF Transcript_16777/g.31795 Transcript_16777/m.31795 type:complete len:238 (+) Transcript_16777:111-824(+)